MLDEPVPGFRLDVDLVDLFEAGALPEDREAELADQVARLLPYHAELPHPILGALVRIEQKVGGSLTEWLDRHPGRPRLVARIYRIVAVIDEFGGLPGTVTAFAELRAAEPDPPELAPYIPPETTSATLPSLAQGIESRLADDELDHVTSMALATIGLLERIAPPAADQDARARDFPGAVRTLREDVLAATG
jgi:hypothetical protein